MEETRPLLLALIVLFFFYLSSPCRSQISDNEPKNYPADEYGDRDWQYGLPNYDINTDPISAWFFKKDTTYVGFIIAGHAEKAICEVASLEIANKTQKLDSKHDSVFSFGIGYNFNTEQKRIEKYHDIIIDMKSKFEELEAQTFPKQVIVSEVDYEEYISKRKLIENHISLANSTNEWGTHIVEYKLSDYPVITPFFDANTSNEITFEVPKMLFGEIPNELARKTILKNIINYKNEIKSEIKRLKDLQYALKNLSLKDIASSYPRLNKSNRLKYPENENLNKDVKEYLSRLNTYGELDIIPIQTKHTSGDEDQFGILHNKQTKIYSNDISFDEFVSGVYKENNLKDEFVKWVKEKITILIEFEFGYISLNNKISKIENEQQRLITIEKAYSNKIDINYIVDAFLRGWAFNTENDNLNKQLDDWYQSKRKIVWEYILSKVPNAKVNDKLGGIFHTDDVFFRVITVGDLFKITPYKITGGNFVQVIDKEIGISYLTSPLNYRYSKK